ncbi:MAG TPA: polyvinylalcohol dehydrogenase, partial [Planctomycetota bacterium]|nr:polyvinylalcohol dehydrogenase [Planctomycetota bacterium]
MLTHRVLAALRFVLPVVILVAAEAPSAAIAGDWPQWRGVGRDGHSTDTGLLKAWPKGGPKLVWKITGVGIGYSSLAVADGRIYTLGDGKDRSALVAMDLDGK